MYRRDYFHLRLSSYTFQLPRIGSAYAVGYFLSALTLFKIREFTQCRSSKIYREGSSLFNG